MPAAPAREKYGPLGIPARVAVAAPDEGRLLNGEIHLVSLGAGGPERGADGHAELLGIAGLPRVRLAPHLVFLGQLRVEDRPNHDVAVRTTGAGNHATSSGDVHVTVACKIPRNDPEHPARGRLLSHDADHPMLEKNVHAGCTRSAFERPDDSGTSRIVDVVPDVAGRGHHPGSPRRQVAFRRQIARRGVTEQDTLADEEIEDLDVVVGERSDDLAIVEARHRMIAPRVIQIDGVRRILNAVLFLDGSAAANIGDAVADDRVAAHVGVLFNQNYRCPEIACANRCRHAGRAGAYDHDVNGSVPARDLSLSGNLLGARAGKGGEANARGPAGGNEVPPRNTRALLLVTHRRAPAAQLRERRATAISEWPEHSEAGIALSTF